MRVEVWASTRMNGIKVRNVIEIDDEEWNTMSDEDKDTYFFSDCE